jgi:hypothetical protein
VKAGQIREAWERRAVLRSKDIGMITIMMTMRLENDDLLFLCSLYLLRVGREHLCFVCHTTRSDRGS